MPRLIQNEHELFIVFFVLLCKLAEESKKGNMAVFPPDKVILPENMIQDKKWFSEKGRRTLKIAKKDINFSFEAETRTDMDIPEAIRQLGITLYHLASGKSELTHESFWIDGYRRVPFEGADWPFILAMIRGEIKSVKEVFRLLRSERNVVEGTTQPSQPTASAATAGKTKSANNIIRELANEKIKIIGHEGVANFWGIPVPQDVQILYSEETLREAIQANQNGEQWALAYYAGHSARQMRDKWGVDTNNQPCVYNNDWWLKNEEDYWATKMLEPGYYLLNYNGKFASKKWSDQESLIAGMGPLYERAHEFVVGETVLSNFSIHNGERLLENWYHWGKESGSGGDRVCIGHFGSVGLGVHDYSPGFSSGRLRVVVFRKFDF